MSLGAFLTATGQHVAAWRHPDVLPDGGTNFRHYAEIVQLAEAGKFDLMFLADNAGVWERDLACHGRSSRVAHFEPITLLSALAAVTSRIGLVATCTTSFHEPYNVARQFASLDLVSGGRAGWNVVTSANAAEAYNFGLDEHPLHADRYERAKEFVAVVSGLWDSWADDAFLYDKEKGIFYDPSKVQVLGHAGKHFRVRGPLNAPRTPQGRPVIVQAGSSEAGMELAAETADVVFTAQQTIEDGRRFYKSLKEKMPAFGREPDDLKVLPGLSPVVGTSPSEAEDKFEALQALIHPEVGLELLGSMLGGVNLSGYALDEPLPVMPESNTGKGRQAVISCMAQREGLTLRETYLRVAGARGHNIVVGTARQIADEMEAWFVSGAADGFNIMPQTLPGGLEDFIRKVTPELQRRGLFRSEYEGATLRENLGLRWPQRMSIGAIP